MIPDTLAPPPLWVWGIGIFLLIFTRFYHLDSLPYWPIWDEARMAYNAIEFIHQWDSRLLFTESHNEPLIVWTLTPFFKIFGPSIFSLRLYGAVLSLLTVIGGYLAARQFFSKATAFLIAWLLAFTFWPYLLDRISLMACLLAPISAWLFWILGLYLKNSSKTFSKKNLLILCLLNGLGFYSYTAWPVVTLAVGAALFFQTRGQKSRDWRPLLYFAGSTLLLAFPIIQARLSPHGLDHIHQEWDPMRLWEAPFRYIGNFFWNDCGITPFGPNWGGLLNPILASLGMVGLLECYAYRRSRLIQWFLFGLIVLSLPGMLSRNFEVHRFTPLLIPVLCVGALGLRKEGLEWKKPYRWAAIMILLAGSLVLDSYHFLNYYARIQLPTQDSANWRPVENYKAYAKLKDISEKEGPLVFLQNLTANIYDSTLRLACYPFNAADNPNLDPQKCCLFAFLIEQDEASVLQSRFPGLQVIPLADGDARQSHFFLHLIPITPQNQATLQKWLRADEALKPINTEWNDTVSKTFAQKIIPQLMEIHPLFEGDPFLETVFWEKAGFAYEKAEDNAGKLKAYEETVKTGYATPIEYKLWASELAKQHQRQAMDKVLEQLHRVERAARLKKTS